MSSKIQTLRSIGHLTPFCVPGREEIFVMEREGPDARLFIIQPQKRSPDYKQEPTLPVVHAAKLKLRLDLDRVAVPVPLCDVLGAKIAGFIPQDYPSHFSQMGCCGGCAIHQQ